MKLYIDISRKGFTINRQPGQELGSFASLLPRTSFDYQAQVNGYQSAIIMACVNWIQRTFPEAPVTLEQADTEGQWGQVTDHFFLDILDQPNPYYDGLLLQAATVADLTLSGNSYWLKIRAGAGRVLQLWWLPSTLVEPKWPYDGSAYLTHYEYSYGTGKKDIPVADIVHFRYGFDPNNIRKGLSPLGSLFREVFTDDEAANMTASLLRNLGVPGLVISPGKDTIASPEDAKAVKKWFQENFGGDKRGEPLVMPSSTEVATFGFSPQQMDLKALRRIPEERITAVLGVPAIVAGLGAGLDRSTFANYAEAREAAYESNIIPTQRLTASVMKRQLLRDYQDDLSQWRVGYDLSEVRVLQEDENKRSQRIIAEVNGGLRKVVDGQRELGAAVDETQDYYLRPFNMVPVMSGELPTPRAEEKPAPELEQGAKALQRKAMDEAGKEAHWRGYALKADKYERIFVTSLRGMFAAQEREALKNLKAGSRENFINQPNAKKTYRDTATPVLMDLMGQAVADARNLVAPAKAVKGEGLTNPYAVNWLKTRIGWAAEQVGEETANLLAQKLAEGFANGESMDELAGRVKQVFSFCSDVRAKRVSRTETIAASAQGAIEGYKEAGVGKVEFYAALDERLCPDCNALHGKQFALEESRGVITVHSNCRCTWLPVIE